MSDIKKIQGKIENKDLLNEITRRRNELFTKESTLPDDDPDVEVISQDPKIKIPKKNMEEYNALNELENSFLLFGTPDEEQNDKVYDIPGVKVTIGGVEKYISIKVRADKIADLAIRAKEYEDKFSKDDGSLKIKFPNQVYQFKHGNQPIPGASYQTPRPKLASESTDEYEQFLKDEYGKVGVQPEADETWRKPYPHEYVDYKGQALDKKDQVQSEYYQIEHQQKKAKKAQPGEKNSVIGTQDFKDSPLFEKLRHGFGAIGEAFSAPDARRKIIHTALTVAGGVGYVAVMANLNLLVPGLAVPGILMVANWIRNRLQLKKDLEAEKEKQKENGSPSDKPDNQQQQQQQQQPTPNDVDLEAELRDINETYKNIATLEGKITALQKQLNELNPQTADYDAKKAELENLIKQANDLLKQTLENLRQAISRVLAAYQIENVGGFKL